ncbi:MAG: hypothetical protein WCG08_05480 [Paludibacter sp.]
MKKTQFSSPKYLKSALFITACVLILFSCSPKLTVHKPLTFSDVEKEFHFASPLPERSQKTILKQFGSVQNYHDSIVARRARPNRGPVIITGHPTEADSALMKIFRMSDEELKKNLIKFSRDTISNRRNSKK